MKKLLTIILSALFCLTTGAANLTPSYAGATPDREGNTGKITFDFTSNAYGLPNDGNTYVTMPTTISEGYVSITFTGDKDAWRFWSDGLRVYYKKAPKFTVSVNGGKVTNVSWETKSSSVKFALDGTTTAITSWNGSEESVTFTGSISTSNAAVTNIKVSYELGSNSKKPAELKFDKTAIEIVKGETFEKPTLTYATDGAITYSSSNPAVAAVNATTGDITIAGIGTATITAVSAETDTYSEGMATYDITILPGLMNVAEALQVIQDGYSGNAQVTGFISRITELDTGSYGNATYFLTDKLGSDVELQVYRGYGLNGQKFNVDGATLISVGDSVTVDGKLVNYQNTTPQFTSYSKIISLTPAVKVSSVTLNKTAVTLKVAQTEQLTATTAPSNAVDKTITWTSSDVNIATVDSTGLVKAVAIGSATITATAASGVTAQCAVTVAPTQVEKITLDKTSAQLKAKETVQLTATVTPADALDKTLTWTSSDTKIATVSSTGLVTAVAVGSATITVKATSGVTAQCAITVNPTPVEKVTLDKTSAQLKAKETVQLTATITPTDATDKTITWTSSNTNIATVSATGLVTAVAVGSATITAKATSGVTAQCAITVNPTPVEKVTLDKTAAQLKVKETVQLTATITPTDATDKTLTWTSSDTKIATVSATGLVTAVALGSATITAKAASGVTAQCAITVIPTPVEKVTLDKTAAQLKVKETVQLTATVTPTDATDKTITWTSSDTKVATVSSTGLVTAVALGSATITAKAASGVTAQCAISVVQTPVEKVTLDKTSAQLKAKETVQLTATVTPADATDKTVTWTSSDTKVATVSSTGLVTAVAVGSATITASASGVTAQCAITVNPTPVETVKIDQNDSEVRLGTSIKLTATVGPADATDKTVTWTSSDTKIATVDANGLVTTTGMGVAEITATAGGISDKIKVTVIAPLATSITLSMNKISATVGEKTTLKATVLPKEADGQTLTWTTSDASVATVTPNGEVTIVGVGKATITVTTTDGSNLSDTCSVDGISGIMSIFTENDNRVDIYNMNGLLLKKNADYEDYKNLAPGVYIINGKKILKR